MVESSDSEVRDRFLPVCPFRLIRLMLIEMGRGMGLRGGSDDWSLRVELSTVASAAAETKTKLICIISVSYCCQAQK